MTVDARSLTVRLAIWTGLVLGLATSVPCSQAQAPPSNPQALNSPSTSLDQIGFDQRLGNQIPLGLIFRDEAGREVRLSEYFGKRPVVLTLVYYNCPLLCTQVLNGLERSLKPLSLDLGKDFDIVTVSIDPNEGPELSALKKRAYIERYGRPGAEKGWHFLTGDESNIKQLAQAVGFRYTYNPRTRLYAHAAGITIATPTGKLARYLFGIEYPPRDLQFTLVEASAGKVGTAVAKVLLLCYDYDAAGGKYTLAIMRLTRIIGSASAALLASFIYVLVRRERRKADNSGSSRLQTPLPSL